MDEEALKVAAYWSRNVAGSDSFSPLVYWLAVPEIHARHQRRACGSTGYPNWVSYCLAEHLLPAWPVPGRMLSVGCGTGALERQLHDLKAFERCDAWEIAPGALEIARREAAAARISTIHYELTDIQQKELVPASYQAVWFNGSLHHLSRLEWVLGQVRSALLPGGFVFLNEYVGASRFDFPKRQRECIEACFRLLPERLRRSFVAGQEGRLMETPTLPDPVALTHLDPSEAVRSGEILAVLGQNFDVVAQNLCGGTILQFLLSGIAGNFRSEDREAIKILEILFAIEDSLIDSGELGSDFVVLAARARPLPASTKWKGAEW
jgi:SAM-dependent methyltransferase